MENTVATNSRKRPSGDSGRCTKQSSKRNYSSKKRKGPPNRYTKLKDGAAKKKDSPVSVKKIKRIRKRKTCCLEGYRLIDVQILENMICSLACPSCFEKDLFVVEDPIKRKGLASHISIRCTCGYEKEDYTSKVIVDNKNSVRGMKPCEVNTRIVYALRTCGLGHAGLEKFCMIMNIPKPMTVVNFDAISNKVRDSVKVIADFSMKNAADELQRDSSQLVDIGVTVDGTWQRRGYTSMNGVVVAMSVDSGKVLDIEVLSRFCKSCSSMGRILKDDPQKLEEWLGTHEESCPVNYTGTAPVMEVEGAKRMFERSITNRNIRYTSYCGEGDSKAYQTVKFVYGPDKPVQKFECIGHYQKCVGCRLRKLKKETKGMRELTPVVIDKLQNYFGIALRANCTTVENMQRAIWASFFHVASSKENDYHSHCEASVTSWCQFQRDKINNTNLYKVGSGLSLDIVKLIKPIYLDLVKESELKKCLHGKT